MFGLFNKKRNAPAPQAAAAQTPAAQTPAPAPTNAVPAAGGIAYYPDLIKELVADHRQLQKIEEKIKNAFERRELAQVARELQELGALLRSHLLKENMRLYIYLQQRVADDEVNTALVRSFRKEMDGVAKGALAFLEKYQAIETLPAAELAGFAAELEQIGIVVHGRMQREEDNLYPLYAPHY